MSAVDMITALFTSSAGGVVTDVVAAIAIVLTLRTRARQRRTEAEMKAIEERMHQQWLRAAAERQTQRRPWGYFPEIDRG